MTIRLERLDPLPGGDWHAGDKLALTINGARIEGVCTATAEGRITEAAYWHQGSEFRLTFPAAM